MSAPLGSIADLIRSQDNDWKELSFIGPDCAWKPATLAETDDDLNAYAAKGILGTAYALELIGHLKYYGRTIDTWNGLPDVIESMVGAKLDPVAKTFLATLGEFIACGDVILGSDFTAVQPSRRVNIAPC